jgi:hypothetical protein
MNSIRIRIDDPVFYPSMLHTVLGEGFFNGKIEDGGRNVRVKEIIGKKEKYVYLVTFRLLKKDSNEITYNYICYPNIFTNSLLGHLILKSGFSSSFLFKEWGDFYTIIDNSLGVGNTMNEIKDSFYELNEHWSEYRNSSNFNKADTCLDILDHLKKTTVLVNSDDLIEYLDLIIKKDYLNFLVKRFGKEKEELFKEIITYKDKDIYLLKDCVFVVRDIDYLLQSLLDKRYKISQEKKVMKNGLTSSSSFLSHLDSDYRHNLYKHHLNKVQHNIIPAANKLSRSKFSFYNVHQKIGNIRLFTTSCKKFILEDKVIKNRHYKLGNVRYYSTLRNNLILSNNSILSNIYITNKKQLYNKNYGIIRNISVLNKVVDNRQKLFEVNYELVRNILNENYNVGSKEVQEKIELAVRTQENKFQTNNLIKTKLNFNDETYEFILNVQEKLCKLLSYPDDVDINTNFNNSKFIPLYKKIILELGVEYVSDLLLSFYMEILTKETISLEDKETPGISTISAFDSFGKKIFERFIYNRYLKSDIKQMEGSLSEFKLIFKDEFEFVYNENGFHVIIGGYFVRNLLTVRLLTEVLDKHPENPKEDIYYLRLVQNVREIFLKNNLKVFHLPQKLPMVCEPKDHVYSSDPTKNKLGGYLLNDVHYTSDLIKDRIGYGDQTILKDKNIIVSLVNGLSKTPYKINTETLEYIYKFGLEKNIIIDDSSEEIRSFINNPYKKYTKKYSIKYRSIVSKILMERNVLSIAETFSKVEYIYFPVRLDFRTRIYCVTDFFDYQKSDLAKGLISFGKPGHITKFDSEAIKYFKAYGANMFGYNMDKKSLNYRVKWIDDNKDKLLNFESNDMVNKAESKVCFISFCFEYKRFIEFMNNKDSIIFYTYLPIQLDATCNGYQHLALLTHETKIFSKLNLDASTHDDDPNDYYSYIAEKAREYMESEIKKSFLQINENKKEIKQLNNLLDKKDKLKKLDVIICEVDQSICEVDQAVAEMEYIIDDVEQNKEKTLKKIKKIVNKVIKKVNKEIKNIEITNLNYLIDKTEKQGRELKSLIKLQKLNLGRSIIKKILMRESYSAGLPRLVENVLSDESIVEIERNDKNIFYKHINSDILFERYDVAIYVKFLKHVTHLIAPKIDALSKYLNTIVSICTGLSIPIPWTLPSGAEINGSYLIEKERKIAAFSFTKTKYTFKKFLPKEYDIKKQRRAIRPNLIHSLDATTIAVLYSYLENVDLYTVHDCFAVTANNAPLLIYKLKMVYRRLYSSNIYLLDFDKMVRITINNTFGDKVFEVNGKYINNPNYSKPIPFPDITNIIDINSKNRINNIQSSAYPAI